MTEQLRDEVARAIGETYDGFADPDATPNNWARATEAADAAIAIVLERCAQVAENRMPVIQCMSVEPVIVACTDITAEIRALQEQNKESR